MLPREIFGKSTFELAMMMMKWLPVWIVDKILLVLTWFILGNTESYGLKRPSIGPLELKNTYGKTPVLDVEHWRRSEQATSNWFLESRSSQRTW